MQLFRRATARRRLGRSAGLALLAVVVAATPAVAATGTTVHLVRTRTRTSPTVTRLAALASGTSVAPPHAGLYAGPGSRTAGSADAFGQWAGLGLTELLDFPPETTWSGETGITGPGWLLGAYRDRPERLEYSLPMMPAISGTSLAACAAGSYNAYWAETGRNLVAYAQDDAVVRPGWEFNAGWYRWSASGKVEDYIGCFRQIVTTMRATPAQRFRFDWNPNLGSSPFPAETAYPGDAYVDVVGVDVYDTSWTWYPTPAGVTTAQARDKAWNWILRGDHGLLFWRDFAAAHGKSMAVPEWALTLRSDGHGGGDNPQFVTSMLAFLKDPLNHVAYWHYFNHDGSSVRHEMTSSTTPFPLGAQTFRTTAAS